MYFIYVYKYICIYLYVFINFIYKIYKGHMY